jgi:D-sedoheptulose 7-phosphate isomerase
MSYFKDYFAEISKISNQIEESKLIETSALIDNVNKSGGKIIIAGNGGSSAIASHCVVDLVKAARIRSICFSDPALMTCFSNDYGYSQSFSKGIEFYADQIDMVILISSSGESENMINAASQSKLMGLPLITLSGFDENNRLSSLGNINLWANSKSYNFVETVHQTWLLSIIDYLISLKN